MNDLTLVRYNVQAVLLEEAFLPGVQSLSIDIQQDSNNLVSYGVPSATRTFRKKPTADISIRRVLSNNTEPLIITGSSGILEYYGLSTWENAKSYKIQTIIGKKDSTVVEPSGTSLVFEKCLLRSLNYSFSSDGKFTENIGMFTHVFASGSGGMTTGNRTGIVKTRQDFNISGCEFPSELSGILKMETNRVLKSVDISIAMNWNELPFHGQMTSYKHKFIQFPLDITCSFNVLDLGYSQLEDEYDKTTYNIIDDYYSGEVGTPDRIIKISAGGFAYDLGSGNILTSINRNGGDADNTGYSTYTYTYKNSKNQFKIIRE
jgi:hypothetical protein